MDYRSTPKAAGNTQHYWMADVAIYYRVSDMPNVQMRRMNIVLSSSKKLVNHDVLNSGRGGALGRFYGELPPGTEEKDVTIADFVYGAISYLGAMTEKQFAGNVPQGQERMQ